MVNMSNVSGKSNVLRKITSIKNMIIDIIDENQEIKRLARYLSSKNPLDLKGLTYDNKIIDQPNLNESLKFELRDGKDVCASNRREVLIPYMFDKNLLEEEKLLIFVYSPLSRLREYRNGTVEHEFWITVAVNVDYEAISPLGNERSLSVLCSLLDEVEGSFINEKYWDDIGYIKFELSADRTSTRISDKGFIATTIPLVVKMSCMRGSGR